MTPRREGTVCFLIKDRRTLLALIEYAPGDRKWTGVGGMTETGESPQDAVIREVMEETGLHLSPESIKEVHFIDSTSVPLHIFFCHTWTGEPQYIDPSIKEFRWFAFDEIPYDTMWAGNKDWLPTLLSKIDVGTT